MSDVLVKIEKSFGLSFSNSDFKNLNTLGELCDMIMGKIEGDDSND